MTPRSALRRAVATWRNGRPIDTFTAAILAAAGYDVPALEQAHMAECNPYESPANGQ